MIAGWLSLPSQRHHHLSIFSLQHPKPPNHRPFTDYDFATWLMSPTNWIGHHSYPPLLVHPDVDNWPAGIDTIARGITIGVRTMDEEPALMTLCKLSPRPVRTRDDEGSGAGQHVPRGDQSTRPLWYGRRCYRDGRCSEWGSAIWGLVKTSGWRVDWDKCVDSFLSWSLRTSESSQTTGNWDLTEKIRLER